MKKLTTILLSFLLITATSVQSDERVVGILTNPRWRGKFELAKKMEIAGCETFPAIDCGYGIPLPQNRSSIDNTSSKLQILPLEPRQRKRLKRKIACKKKGEIVLCSLE